MTCDMDTLSHYLDGELAPGRYREVAEHVLGCETCRADLAAMREINRVMVEWGSRNLPVPIEGAERTRAAIARRTRFPRLAALSRMTSAAVGTAAAALLVMVSVNLAPLYHGGSDHTAPSVETANAQLRRQTEPYVLLHNRPAMEIHAQDAVALPARHHSPLPD